MTTDLSKKMVLQADRDLLSPDHPLRVKAAELDLASEAFFSGDKSVSVEAFVGTWVRARRVWGDYCGEEPV